MTEVRRVKVAVATNGDKGLDDEISEVFGKAKTFTLVDIENGRIKGVRVIKNPGTDYKYGSGPIAAKTLIDEKVEVVIASEVGPNVTSILSDRGVRIITVAPGRRVQEVVQELINEGKL